jgi:ABC-2 type transport system ATP-binding protein
LPVPALLDKIPASDPEGKAGVIEALGLAKQYGEIEAVKDVSFRVERGEIVGLLGPNGAGKTTIMKMLTCSLRPTRGTARVAGKDVFEDPLGVKKAVGYLAENAPLYSDLTVEEYLDFMGDARGLSAGARRKGMERVVEDCGLGSVLHRGINGLSKGFRQRVGLAQAMIHDPEILILDEPTTGLDPQQIVEIRGLITGMEGKKTVMLSTHILAEAEASCGRVLILNEGKIVARGSREEIERELRGEITLDLVLRDASAEGMEEQLLAMEGVRAVVFCRSSGEGRFAIRASLAPGGGAEERIFDWAVGRGSKILAMVPRRLSLEDIFLKITGEPAT